MRDTLLLIGGLVPIIITESSSKDEYFSCSPIFLEVFDELFHGFDELLYEILLLLLLLEILKKYFFCN